jgi:hypothetical protein
VSWDCLDTAQRGGLLTCVVLCCHTVAVRTCSHLSSWLDQYQSDPTACEVRDMVRDMNCATSQKVFIGEYTRLTAQLSSVYTSNVADKARRLDVDNTLVLQHPQPEQSFTAVSQHAQPAGP